MALARELVKGTRAIKVRAGKSLQFTISWLEKDEDGNWQHVPATDFTAHLQIKDLNNSRKVLLDAEEAVSPTSPISRFTDDDGNERWMIFLGKTYTSWLPESSLMECELINDNNPEQVVGLFSVVLKIQPQGVA